MNTAIAAGATVSFHYTLTIDGNVVDSSSGRDPLTYVQGEGQIVEGLEEQMAGLKAGDKRTFSVSPEKGYGARDPGAVHKVPKTAFENADGLQAGAMVQGNARGVPFQAVVAEVGETDIVLDLNHPLAGKTLSFDVEVVAVKTA